MAYAVYKFSSTGVSERSKIYPHFRKDFDNIEDAEKEFNTFEGMVLKESGSFKVETCALGAAIIPSGTEILRSARYFRKMKTGNTSKHYQQMMIIKLR